MSDRYYIATVELTIHVEGIPHDVKDMEQAEKRAKQMLSLAEERLYEKLPASLYDARLVGVREKRDDEWRADE